MRARCWIAFAAGAATLAAPALAAAGPGSFVYVVATTCDTRPCAINLVVYDAATAGLVTTIPLAIGKAPAAPGLAISPDGSRLYASVSVGTSPAVVVVDATRHQSIGIFGSAFPGRLAVSHDGKLLFDATSGLQIYDIATQNLVASIPSIAGNAAGLAADPVQDRVYWVDGNTGACFGFSEFRAYDTALGSTVPVGPPAASPSYSWSHVFLSRDGSR